MVKKILKFLKPSKSVWLFIAGLLAGFVPTFVFYNISDDFIENIRTQLKPPPPKPAIVEREFDPFAGFDFPMNDRIQARINYYLRNGIRNFLVESYSRSGRYLPMIQAVFEEYNIPLHISFLPILESGFKPHSRSRVGAVGLWQIMPATASDHGLKYNRWMDERRDPEKSTIAAAEYLQFLYERFHNWELSLAAYNYGFAKLQRAMRRERTNDFWELARIPRETYNFVPNFYAILHIVAHPEKYGMGSLEMAKPLNYEIIDIEATFSINQIAKLANISPGIIKEYNPALISNIAPSGTYAIRVPVGVKDQFLEQYKASPPERVEITYTTYRVRRGDTLYEIAKKFGTTVNAIKYDNNLRSTRWIKRGRVLKIASVHFVQQAVDDEQVETTLAIGEDSSATSLENAVKFIYSVERNDFSLKTLARYFAVTVNDLRSWNPRIQSERLQTNEKVIIYKAVESLTTHRTRRGDSLWKLARRYNTTVGNIKRWNQLQSSRIYPRQQLIVRMI